MSSNSVFTVSERRSILNVPVLRDYFELSGQSIHKTVTSNHFLTISGELERNMTGILVEHPSEHFFA